MVGQPVKRAALAVIVLIALVLTISLYFGGRLTKQAAETNETRKQMAESAVEQYRMMSHHGAASDRCVQAGMVVAAYLQAKDDSHYQAWKRTLVADCTLAGVPQ